MLGTHRWVCVLMIAVAVNGAEPAAFGGKGQDFETSWYDAETPMVEDDPLLSIIDDLTKAARPEESQVVRSVFDAAGETLPSAESFRDTDLGEGEESMAKGGTQAGLKSFLSESASDKAHLDHWVSLHSLQKVLDRTPDTSENKAAVTHVPKVKRARRRPSMMKNVPSDGELWNQAMNIAKSSTNVLDRSKPFLPPGTTVELQLSESPEDIQEDIDGVKEDLADAQTKMEHEKQEVQSDMRIAEITSNTEDYNTGLKEEKKLDLLTHEVRSMKREKHDLEMEKVTGTTGREDAQDAHDLESRVERRLQFEHLRVLKLHAHNMQKKAYRLKMESAKLYGKSHEKGSGVTAKDVQASDVQADLAVDRSKAANEALQAALGETTDDFSAALRQMPQEKGKRVSRQEEIDNVQDIASRKAESAMQRIQDSLDNDSGIEKASQAAKVALSYEKAADETYLTHKDAADTAVIESSAKANAAMKVAIQKGDAASMHDLKQAMAARDEAKTERHNLLLRRSLTHSIEDIAGVDSHDKVRVSHQIRLRSDAKYYANAKKAEALYEKLRDAHNRKAIEELDQRASAAVQAEKDAQHTSSQKRLNEVKVRSQVAEQQTRKAEEKFKAAVNSEKMIESDYRNARVYALNAIRSKDSATLKSEHAEELYRDSDDKLKDAKADEQEDGDKYRRLKFKTKRAQQALFAATHWAKDAAFQLKQGEEAAGSLKRETAMKIKGEMNIMKEEVKVLKAAGDDQAAEGAKDEQRGWFGPASPQKAFLDTQEKAELDRRIAVIKKQSAEDLALKMDEVVRSERTKLERAIHGERNVINGKSPQMKTRMEDIAKESKQKTAEKVNAVLEQPLHRTDMSDDRQHDDDPEFHADHADQKSTKSSTLDKFFAGIRKVKHDMVIVNDGAKTGKDAKELKGTVKKLAVPEMTSDKPLEQAEEELQMVISADKKAAKKLQQKEESDEEKAQHLETKYNNAKSHLRNARRENSRNDFTADGVLTKEYKKKEAARKIVEDTKLEKLSQKREQVEADLTKEKQKMDKKREAVKEATQQAERILDELRKSEINKTKIKIMEAKARHEKWKMRNLRDKVTEAKLQKDDAAREYDELGERLDHARARYNKEKAITMTLKARTEKLGEVSKADARHAKVLRKVAKMADHRYHEAQDEVRRSKKEAALAKRVMKAKNDDLAYEQQSETNAIMDIQKQGMGALEGNDELGDVVDLGSDDEEEDGDVDDDY